MNKAKMTFRFDQEQRSGVVSDRRPNEQQVIPLHPAEYKVTPIDVQTLNPYPNDFGGWQSSFDTETQRVEKLIRESGQTASPPLQPLTSIEEPTFSNEYEYTQPIRDHRWYIPEETVHNRKRSGGSWIKVTASVAGAIVTGAACGFLVLSMFTEDTSKQTAAITGTAPANLTTPVTPPKPGSGDKAAPVAGAVVTGSPAAKAAVDKPLTADPMASVAVSASVAGSTVTGINIPAKTLIVLQSGVFSTLQGADTAQADLKKKGLAAVSDSGEKYPVYVGLAANRDEAAKLAQQFQQKKLDVIVKSIDMPALTKIKWSGKSTDILPAFITQGDNLVQQIAPLTIVHLSESKQTGIDASLFQSVKTAHQTWTGMTSGVNEGLTEEGKAAVLKISNAMNTAVSSLEEYRKNPSTSIMWQTQNAILQAALAQKDLRKIITAT